MNCGKTVKLKLKLSTFLFLIFLFALLKTSHFLKIFFHGAWDITQVLESASGAIYHFGQSSSTKISAVS